MSVYGHTWRAIDPERLYEIGEGPGVYAVFIYGDLAYIGQSENLRRRLDSHFSLARYSAGWFTTWGYIGGEDLQVRVAGSRRAGDWLMREYRLVKRLRPPLNKVWSR